MSRRFMITVIALLSALVVAVVVAVIVVVNLNAGNNAEADYDACMSRLGYSQNDALTDVDVEGAIAAAEACAD